MNKFEISIGKLECAANWPTWKHKVTLLLRGSANDLERAINGTLKKPVLSDNDAASEEARAAYQKALKKYHEIDCAAQLVLTANISDENVQKIMRFCTAQEVWDELHRLYDGTSEDRSYDLCMQFLSNKKNPDHDMTTHLSKIKNLWFELKTELAKDEKSDLPDILLICKILDTLPEAYFSFKSSWILLSKKNRTVESFTSQLCAHEKALLCKNEDTAAEALVTSSNRDDVKRKGKKL